MVRTAELADKLKVCRQTIIGWVKQGMPVHYVGRIPFFDTDEVDAWMKSQNNKQ